MKLPYIPHQKSLSAGFQALLSLFSSIFFLKKICKKTENGKWCDHPNRFSEVLPWFFRRYSGKGGILFFCCFRLRDLATARTLRLCKSDFADQNIKVTTKKKKQRKMNFLKQTDGVDLAVQSDTGPSTSQDSGTWGTTWLCSQTPRPGGKGM